MNRQYPRPNMVRDNIYMLDGEWIANDQQVQVPYPLQSELSGYEGDVPDFVTYRKCFTGTQLLDNLAEQLGSKDKLKDRRFILRFEAVDQKAIVKLNSILLGEHIGGYLGFEFDITDVLNLEGDNELVVDVIDQLDTTYPYGKQTKNPEGMWYTPVTGIWKSVYIESVPDSYIQGVRANTNDTQSIIEINLSGGEEPQELKLNLYDGILLNKSDANLYSHMDSDHIIYSKSWVQGTISREEGAYHALINEEVIGKYINSSYKIKLWNEYTPYLYPVEITYGDDVIYSYIAFRRIAIENLEGIPRVCLNGEAVFMHGVLDQGYYQDGIMTPKEYIEYDRDILRMKSLGYNTLRKHIKIESAQFYYACDRLGMYVVQDMVNSGQYHYMRDTIFPTLGTKYKRDDLTKSYDRKRKDFFIQHSIDTIRQLYNYPSIICYTIFNEGWGQFEADKVYNILRKEDPSRLYDATSGWFKQKDSDFDSRHVYFRNAKQHFHKKPLFLSECGGYSYNAPGHSAHVDTEYGYGRCQSEKELTDKIQLMYREMVYPSIRKGMCGCIYTQLSDVENEINGLYTYDRCRRKVIKKNMLAIRDRIDREMALVNILGRECNEEFFQ